MMSEEEIGVASLLVQYDGHPPKTSPVSSVEQINGDKADSHRDSSKTFNRRSIFKGGHFECTQRRRTEVEGAGIERDSHYREASTTSQTLLGGRVLRNRRSRRIFDENRHTKRLFTPEIKKYLKGWLIRRREHPYPNREEKKTLAVETGLTYIQICNWFANWRRKLKNAGSDDQRTWSHLIKSYNTQAEGNVEQISITSDDSIWERRELMDADDADDEEMPPASPFTPNIAAMDHCYSVLLQEPATKASITQEANDAKNVPAEKAVLTTTENQPQCFTISSTTTEDEETSLRTGEKCLLHGMPMQNSELPVGKNNKYKRHIMEKYMNDLKLDTTHIMDVGERNWKREIPPPKRPRESDADVYSSEWRCGKNKCGWQDGKKRKSNSGRKGRELCPPVVLSKWLESAAKFQPTKSYVPWTVTKDITWPKKTKRSNLSSAGDSKVSLPSASHEFWLSGGHQRAELDAAEALTCLSAS